MTNQNHGASGPGFAQPHDDLDMSAEQLRGGYIPTLGVMVDGKYRIDRLIARGGMGAVFAATHCVSGKKVALKWMLPALGQVAGARERFVREARATARIAHPNIVDIYDVGTEHDSVYLVMEYLRGETLADRLARMRLLPEEAIALLMPALRGIAEAHRYGVIHRDLKPDNIFLCCTDSGTELEATVLDFGISKIADDELRELELTHSGTVLGTPYYMAPEQVRGARDVDLHADIYSIGVMLFEVFAGQKPFDADTYNELILKIATEPPPQLSSIAPEVHPGLAAIVERAMARDAGARFHSIEELALALEEFAGGIRFQGQRAPGFRTTVSGQAPDVVSSAEPALSSPSPRAVAAGLSRPSYRANANASAHAQLSVRTPALPAPLPQAPPLPLPLSLPIGVRGRVNVASIAIALTLFTGGAVYLASYSTQQPAAPRAGSAAVVPAVEASHAAPASSIASALNAVTASPATAPAASPQTAPAPADTGTSPASHGPVNHDGDSVGEASTEAAVDDIPAAQGSPAGKLARSPRSSLEQVSRRPTQRRERTSAHAQTAGEAAARASTAASAASTDAQSDWDSRIMVAPSQAASKPDAPAGSIGTGDF